MLRTHTAGELRVADVGKTVTLAGWVDRRRDHGDVTFIDLRDRYGKTQVVANATDSGKAHAAIKDVRSEWVLQVRAPGTGDRDDLIRVAGSVTLAESDS